MACWSRSALLWLLAGACGLALLGYCVYFDRKRRNAADFKLRLREKRRKEQKKAKEHKAESLGSRQPRTKEKFPDRTINHWNNLSPEVVNASTLEVSKKRLDNHLSEMLHKLKESEEIQEFFLQEIQLGELWLAKGEQKKSVEHLINAISVCAQPNQLIQVLEQTLPPQVFEMLANSIPYTIQRFETAVSQQNAGDE